jgi:hypothetical protein
MHPRFQILSSSKLRTIRILALVFYGSIMALLLFFLIMEFSLNKKFFWPIYFVALYSVLIYKRMKRIFDLKYIEFDDYNIYCQLEGYEEQIPFYQIKSINLIDPSGIHEIKLHDPSQVGERIFFKPSIWYPFNFKKVDNVIFKLKDLIDSNRMQSLQQQENLSQPLSKSHGELGL